MFKWNPIKDISKGLERTKKNLTAIESGFRRDTAAIGQNIETNVQNQFNSLLALTQPGGLNNFGQTLLNSGLTVATAGLVNPKDTKKLVGETNVQRMESDAISKAENQARADEQALVDESNRQVSTFLQSLTSQRARTPGKAQTLLSRGGANTLLTLR